MRPLLPLLDNVRNATSANAERGLGWKPRAYVSTTGLELSVAADF